MAAIGHAIHTVVNLHRCRCGPNYEQWEDQPNPSCPTCEETRISKTRLGKRDRKSEETTNKRTKFGGKADEGKIEKNDPPQGTKQSPTPYALPDPTPNPRKQTSVANLNTPPEAPTSRSGVDIKQDSTPKKALPSSHCNPRPGGM